MTSTASYCPLPYRVRTIDRLTRAAVAAQSDGRWDAADNMLSLAARFERLWNTLDGRSV